GVTPVRIRPPGSQGHTKARHAAGLRVAQHVPTCPTEIIAAALASVRPDARCFSLGRWRWVLIVNACDTEADTVAIVMIQDARSAHAATRATDPLRHARTHAQMAVLAPAPRIACDRWIQHGFRAWGDGTSLAASDCAATAPALIVRSAPSDAPAA